MALGIPSLTKALRDPFVRTRARTTALYFVLMFVILSASGYVLDSVLRDILAEADLSGSRFEHEKLADRIERIRLILRFVNIAVFTASAYILIGITFAPVRKLIEAQKRFIANVSHELKTPLATLRTEVEVALRHPASLSREEAIALLAKSVERAEHVSRVIQFFRLMADYASPQEFAIDTVFPLSAPVRAAIAQLEQKADAKDVSIVTAFSGEEARILGNQLAIEKLALNLVRNAITYAPSGTAVNVTLLSTEQTVEFSVRDHGPGIEAKDLKRIFEPFERGTHAASGGSGLGLSIVREVARLHNASLTVSSEPGEGALFRVVFTRA